MSEIDLADYGDMHICCVEAAYAGFTSVGADPKHIAALIEHAVALTAERDAAIARAERAEHDRDYLAGYQADLACIDKCLNDIDAPHDCEDGVSLAPRRIRLLGALVHTLTARAEAAEALAASRPEITPEDAAAFIDWRAGLNVTTSGKGYVNVGPALRAHAAKVSR